MEPKNVIMRMFLLVLAVLVMSTGAQAQELREVPASEILEKIQAGEDVNYDGYRITGELNLSEIYLEKIPIARHVPIITRHEFGFVWWGLEEELKIVESEITIINSVFENNVDFSNTRFKMPVDFFDTSFLDISDFGGACFTGGANFRSANFSSNVRFWGASFGGDAHFDYASFDGYASFLSASFGSGVSFWGASFWGDAVFIGANFSSDASFWGANFSSDAVFIDASFGSDVSFWNASFDNNASFGLTSFYGYASFCDASFEGDSDFFRTSFEGDSDFSDASFEGDSNFFRTSFEGDSDFSDASFGGDAIFDFAEFDKVHFSDTTFTKVSLHEADFKSMKVEWASLKDALIFNGPTYIKLIKNFREMEQFEDADDAYYQYRRLSQANKNWSFSKLGDVFMWLSCGYGVRPWRAPAWGVIIIFIFGLIYMPGTLNFWPFTFFDWLRESGIRRLKESDKGDEQDASCCEVLYSSIALLTMIGLILLFCNLGVKPHYTAILAVAMLLIYALIYRGNNINKRDASFCDAFYFSVTTFTTLGYGDWYPKDRYRMFVMIEGLVGWIILALFLVTLANVMIRP